MANTRSAQKQARQNISRHARNARRRTALKTAVKKLLVGVAQKSDAATLNALFIDAQAQLARAQSKGVMHPNAARRKISRLARKVKSQF